MSTRSSEPSQPSPLRIRRRSEIVVPDTPEGRQAFVDQDYITARQCSVLLKVHPALFPKIAAAGKIRRREYPGIAPTYNRTDVERLIAESIKVGHAESPRKRRSLKASQPSPTGELQAIKTRGRKAKAAEPVSGPGRLACDSDSATNATGSSASTKVQLGTRTNERKG